MSNKEKLFLAGLFIGAFFAINLAVIYDSSIRGAGNFSVVNSTRDTLQVQLSFPSGHVEQFELTSAPYEFELSNTGEGIISANVNGIDIGSEGYVTSMNPPMLVVLSNENMRVFIE